MQVSHEEDNAPVVPSFAGPAPFAGRLGGNQAFVIAPGGSSANDALLRKTPDASPLLSFKASFDLRAFTSADLWRQALMEGLGTCLSVWMAGCVAVGLGSFAGNTSLGPVTPALFGAVLNLVQVPLFIYALGPVSGGHVNPLITLTTFACRLSSFPRTVLYIFFQSAGAVVAAFCIRAAVGDQFIGSTIPGCTFDTDLVSPAQAFLIETMSCLTLSFLAIGVGLDPRQRGVYGPAVAPFLVGVSAMYCTFAPSVLRKGYTGASLNPARCLGLMSATQDLHNHWIHWVAPLLSSFVLGIVYKKSPPNSVKSEKSNA